MIGGTTFTYSGIWYSFMNKERKESGTMARNSSAREATGNAIRRLNLSFVLKVILPTKWDLISGNKKTNRQSQCFDEKE